MSQIDRLRRLLPLLLTASGPFASGVVYTYQFTATVSGINGGVPAVYAEHLGLSVGDTITGGFTYDTSATPRPEAPTNPSYADYWSPSATALFHIDTPARRYEFTSQHDVAIRVDAGFYDDVSYVPAQYVDGFRLNVRDPYVGADNPTQVGLSIRLASTSGTTPTLVLTSDSIPGPLPALESWPVRKIGLNMIARETGDPQEYEMGLSAEIVSLTMVPEPRLLSWVTALGMVSWTLWRIRQSRGAWPSGQR